MNYYVNPLLPLRHPSTSPSERGLYVRDWRGTRVMPESDRVLSVDLFIPLPRGDADWPGFWYVPPGWNDASHARLPWRPLTAEERSAFCRRHPKACMEFA